MSATIKANDLKFTIFGAGHDYTLADSGSGDITFFSHPKVPLNSKVYAGQFYFTVPLYDDNDEETPPVTIDAVKDDIAHCTFDPAINDTFDTEGELEVTVHYYREYIYAESTVIVEKELKQTIEVVDHGAISSSEIYGDLYADGYYNFHPQTVNTVSGVEIYTNLQMSKVSNIFWRAIGLGHENGQYFCKSSYLTDISELENADISNCKKLLRVFYGCPITDFSPMKNWDVSKVEKITYLLSFDTMDDLSFLENWNTESLTEMRNGFYYCSMKSLKGLEGWDVSNVTDMGYIFQECRVLEDISALYNWDVSKVTRLDRAFNNCMVLTNLHGIENWDVSSVTDAEYLFYNCKKLATFVGLGFWHLKPIKLNWAFSGTSVTSFEGLENIDTSDVTSLVGTLAGNRKLLSYEGIESWDTSKVTNFYQLAQYNEWAEDFTPFENWDFSHANNVGYLFYNCANIRNFDGIVWNFGSSAMGNAFAGASMYHSETLGKDIYGETYWLIDYEGNQYSYLAVQDAVQYPRDASDASEWVVSGSNKQAFDNKWTNIPSWN